VIILGTKDEYQRVAITSDLDWAPDVAIDYIASIFNQYGIRGTFFCTHRMDVESTAGHEIAIHPNFTKQKSDFDAIKELFEIYPEAKGIRGHGLYVHGGLYDIYEQFGLEYESNFYLPGQVIKPFVIYKGIVELPIYFSDDAPLADPDGFNLADADFQEKGLRIFNFHPMHVFLNTGKYSDYERAKPYIHEPEKLYQFRNDGPGTKDALIGLLEYIKSNHIRCYTMKEISDECRASYDGRQNR